jgi:Family of unknown function (DUF5681)
LLREFGSSVIINENGRRRRISKYEAVIKQLAIKAMSGNLSAIRILLGLCQVASEKDALLGTSQASDPNTPAEELPYDELMKLAFEILKKREREKKRGDISNAD